MGEASAGIGKERRSRRRVVAWLILLLAQLDLVSHNHYIPYPQAHSHFHLRCLPLWHLTFQNSYPVFSEHRANEASSNIYLAIMPSRLSTRVLEQTAAQK